MENYQKMFISIMIPLAVGFIGLAFTSSSLSDWYSDLVKPGFNPPNWVFAPVWTSLYLLMGTAAYLIWKKGYSEKTKPAFLVYLFSFSWIFYGLSCSLD